MRRFVQLANVLSTEALFYACILPFVAFFGSFAFIMYPLRDVLHPTGKSSDQCGQYLCHASHLLKRSGQ